MIINLFHEIPSFGNNTNLFHCKTCWLRISQIVRSPNSRTPISYLNISELPLNRKEIGNTLETRGLTYSYTFLTKPKIAHLGCKGMKRI